MIHSNIVNDIAFSLAIPTSFINVSNLLRKQSTTFSLFRKIPSDNSMFIYCTIQPIKSDCL